MNQNKWIYTESGNPIKKEKELGPAGRLLRDFFSRPIINPKLHQVKK